MTSAKKPRRVPGQTILCGWCAGPVTLREIGRIPKWCSETCRHRAWEQHRAAASGRGVVEVVDRVIEVEREVRIVERIEVHVPVQPRRGEWPDMMAKLAAEIDCGHVYTRDLDAIDEALESVRQSMGRNTGWLPRRLRRQAGPISTSRWSPRGR